MTTKMHNADYTAEVELPTQRYELRQLGSWDNTYGQLVAMDYATDATEGWCDAEDVAKLEDENASLRAEVARLGGELAESNARAERLKGVMDAAYIGMSVAASYLDNGADLDALWERRRDAVNSDERVNQTIHAMRISRRGAYKMLAHVLRERAATIRGSGTHAAFSIRADECQRIAELIESGELLKIDPSVKKMMEELAS